MFWHRILNRHKWVEENRVIRNKTFELENKNTDFLFMVKWNPEIEIHQKCTVCGDRRIINE